jgi:hypothetical protein
MAIDVGGQRASSEPRTRGRGEAPQRSRRDLVVLHPALAARYEGVLASAAPAIETALPEGVLANRVAAVDPDGSGFVLRSWHAERRLYVRRVRALATRADAVLVTDVRRCYASIRIDVVERAVTSAGVERSTTSMRSTVDAIASLLRRFDRLGIEGLPVGPEPSAVLANAVLAAVDERLISERFEHVRWVDDVVVALRQPRDAARAIAVIDDALRSVGLRRHVAKTRVVAPGAAERIGVSGRVRGDVARLTLVGGALRLV